MSISNSGSNIENNTPGYSQIVQLDERCSLSFDHGCLELTTMIIAVLFLSCSNCFLPSSAKIHLLPKSKLNFRFLPALIPFNLSTPVHLRGHASLPKTATGGMPRLTGDNERLVHLD